MSNLDGKKLCKIYKKRLIKDNLHEYIELIKAPKYLCTKCGRVSNQKDLLCKPKKINNDI